MELVQGWVTKPLGEVVTLQRGFDLPHRLRSSGTVPLVSSAGVTDFHASSKVQAPGVVTGRYGTIGEVFFLEDPFWPLNTTLFVRDFHRNEPRFVFYMLQRFDFKTFSGKSGVPGVNRNELHRETVSLPTSVTEHRAIASALSDVDALLGGLDRLIAKKRDLKQAAMQQFLTGQTRLSGFSGEWKTKPLSEIASIRNQKVLPSNVGMDTPCVELDHIGQGNGRLLECSTAQYSKSTKYRFFIGDVLFGRLRSYLRKFWHADRDGICTTEIWPLMTDSHQADSGFLHAIVQSDRFIEDASISYGTHMPRADWGVMRNFEVRLPQVSEQLAIAEVLSDMDAELLALEARRDKARDLKQGMMQELLTGRTRLI